MSDAHEYVPTRSKQAEKRLASGFDWMGSAVTALVAVTLIFALLFRVVSVDGASMTNTLQHGDRLLLSSMPYTPAYGDVVVITRDNDSPLIKRVIGVAGDRIRIDADTGAVYRNDVLLTEPYIRDPSTPQNGMTEEVTVPAGHIFAMGDNRHDSLDSRMLGCLPLEDVVGKTFYRLAPNPGKITNGE